MTLTFTQKEVRKNRKKAREAEERYKKTGEKSFLSKRDVFNDMANKIESNMKTDLQKKKVKSNQEATDDQVFDEAMAYNRKNKKKVEEESVSIHKKQEQMKKRREELIKGLRDREKDQKEFYEKQLAQKEIQEKQIKEYRDEKIKEYMEKNPNSSKSQAQKEFMRRFNNTLKYMEEKEKIIMKLMMLGMDRVKAEETFNKISESEGEK